MEAEGRTRSADPPRHGDPHPQHLAVLAPRLEGGGVHAADQALSPHLAHQQNLQVDKVCSWIPHVQYVKQRVRELISDFRQL